MEANWIAALVAVALVAMEEDVIRDDIAEDILVIITAFIDAREGRVDRTWSLDQNDPQWFHRYVCQDECCNSPNWITLFRGRKDAYNRVLSALRADLKKQETRFGNQIEPERQLASFLMYSGNYTCTHVGSRLGLGPCAVLRIVKDVAWILCTLFKDTIKFPTDHAEVTRSMVNFESIASLPHCAGAIDGRHIAWHRCPFEQYYEYRCYKGYPSIVMLAVCSTKRVISYVQVEKSEVL